MPVPQALPQPEVAAAGDPYPPATHPQPPTGDVQPPAANEARSGGGGRWACKGLGPALAQGIEAAGDPCPRPRCSNAARLAAVAHRGGKIWRPQHHRSRRRQLCPRRTATGKTPASAPRSSRARSSRRPPPRLLRGAAASAPRPWCLRAAAKGATPPRPPTNATPSDRKSVV